MADEPIFQMEFGQMAGEGEDEDVIVSLPADTSVVVTKAASVKTAAAAGDGGDEAVADLKGQFAAMTARANDAERRAQHANDQAQQATQRLAQVEGQVVSSHLDTVLSGLAAAEAEATNAEQAYTAAFEAGDGPAQARAQRKMAAAEVRIQRLHEAKADLEDDVAKTATKQPVAQQPQRRAPVDPVEQFTQQMSPRSAAWIRAHPECVTDPKLNARMLAAHNLAVADDIAPDTDEYFQRIEAGINTKAAKPASDGRRPSSGAAPASGAGGGLNGGTEVRLTRGEAQSATDGTLVWNYDDPSGAKRWTKGDPIGLAEMARRKMEGKKAGLYDKSLSE